MQNMEDAAASKSSRSVRRADPATVDAEPEITPQVWAELPAAASSKSRRSVRRADPATWTTVDAEPEIAPKGWAELPAAAPPPTDLSEARSISKSLDCLVCHEVLWKPKTFWCGHSFCWKCAIGCLNTGYDTVRVGQGDQADVREEDVAEKHSLACVKCPLCSEPSLMPKGHDVALQDAVEFLREDDARARSEREQADLVAFETTREDVERAQDMVRRSVSSPHGHPGHAYPGALDPDGPSHTALRRKKLEVEMEILMAEFPMARPDSFGEHLASDLIEKHYSVDRVPIRDLFSVLRDARKWPHRIAEVLRATIACAVFVLALALVRFVHAPLWMELAVELCGLATGVFLVFDAIARYDAWFQTARARSLALDAWTIGMERASADRLQYGYTYARLNA